VDANADVGSSTRGEDVIVWRSTRRLFVMGLLLVFVSLGGAQADIDDDAIAIISTVLWARELIVKIQVVCAY